jgi:hypothetical protein
MPKLGTVSGHSDGSIPWAADHQRVFVGPGAVHPVRPATPARPGLMKNRQAPRLNQLPQVAVSPIDLCPVFGIQAIMETHPSGKRFPFPGDLGNSELSRFRELVGQDLRAAQLPGYLSSGLTSYSWN